MAATQAFLSNRASQGNLSASAAAAALRTMSPPPTQVGDVQTKRMQRRASNASRSQSPSTRGRPTAGLERQGSSGSMTERTFRRSPSPGRPVSRGGAEAPPPVPSLPRDIPPPPPFRKQAQAQGRTASLDSSTKRVYSPSTRTFVEVPMVGPSGSQTAQSTGAARIASQARDDELERSDSKNSINFSYPRPTSPSVRSPISPNRERQLPKTMRNSITPAQAETTKYDVTHAAEQPVKKKKKKAAPRSSEGSHFERGSMEQRPVTAPLSPGPEPDPEPVPEPVKKKKKKQVEASGESSHFPSDTSPSQASDPDPAGDRSKRTIRASGALLKQPSIVREDWEGEQEQELSEAQQREEQGLSPVSSPVSVQGKKTTAANMSRKIEELQPQAKQPAAPIFHAVTTDHPTSPTSPQMPKEQYLQVEQPQARTTSISPSRSTRFSDRLSSDLSSGRKHEPLPRSVSPAKSALKHHAHEGSALDPNTQPVRDSSVTPSESDSNMSADGSVRRRKSARVSFEPEVEVVGTAAEPQQTDSPTITSPQNKDAGKRGFFGFGRTKPTLTTIPSEEYIEEHMKPRPQLPSFSSTRNKTRRTDSTESIEAYPSMEAQRVAPEAVEPSATSSEASSTSYRQTADQGVSSDRAIGGVLAQEVASQAARSSTYAPTLAPSQRDPDLPLPPEVTSVEGSGYVSDTESDSTNDEVEERGVQQTPVVESYVLPKVQPIDPITMASVVGTVESKPGAAEAEPLAKKVPTLAVHPPTPSIEQTNPADLYKVQVPGGFPVSTEELVTVEESRDILPAKEEPVVSPPSGLGISEPVSSPAVPTAPLKAQPVEESEEESTDNASIYSDAEEDLSDAEGDGFGSINAIVESPIVSAPQRDFVSTPPQSPLAQVSNRPAEVVRTTSWEEPQQKWSGIAKQIRESGAQQSPTTTAREGPQERDRASTTPQPTPRPPPQLQPVPQMQQPKKKKKSHTATAAALASGAGPRQLSPASPTLAPKQPPVYPKVNIPRMDENQRSSSFTKSARTQPAAQGATSSGFRGSMRSQPLAAQPETGFRSSLRAQPPVAQPEGGFRSSMRGQPPARPRSPPQTPALQPEGGFRSSMRGQAAPMRPKSPPQVVAVPAALPEGGFRSSMRGQRAPTRPRSPPQTVAAPASPPRAALQKKHIPLAATAQPRGARAAKPKQRTLSNDSDSDSSFQRTRRRRADAPAFAMRTSMRANAAPQPALAPPTGRGAVRSMSPPQRRPFSPTGEPKAFRSSMRTSLDEAAPTLRGQPEKRSSSLFGKRNAKSPSPAPAKSRPVSRGLQSRIKDSDDEDEPRKKTFRSRFQDSSDEEAEPQPLRPVRGIPRKAEESDSTDLEDSSDEERKVQRTKPQSPKVNRLLGPDAPAPSSQPTVPGSPASPTQKKGLFSRFRSKKEKEEPSLFRPTRAPAQAGTAQYDEEAIEKEATEEKEDGMGNMGFGSKTERDEVIRQTMAKLEAAKQIEQEQSSASTAVASPRQGMGQRVMSDSSARLQRRGMGDRVQSDSWPLPEKQDGTNENSTRPSTSSGLPTKTNGTAIRPGLGQRGDTGNSTASYGRNGKKKRFPKLRKAFGLKD